MTSKIILILYALTVVTPGLAPLLYRNRRPSMVGFYRRMATSGQFRKLYSRMVIIFLISFHFYHLFLYNHPGWLLPSTVLMAVAYPDAMCRRLFRFIQERRTLLAVVVVGLVCALLTEFMPLGFTIVTLAVAAVFYPSHRLLDETRPGKSQELLDMEPGKLIESYYRW